MNLDPYIAQLKSKDPMLRKAAISALGKSGSAQALPILAQVYKNDNSPEIREHARKAGAYLKRSLDSASAAASQPAAPASRPANSQGLMFVSTQESSSQGEVVSAAALPATSLPDPRPAEIIISEKDQRRAKTLVDQAMDAQVAKDNRRTVQLLSKAIALNPKLEKDSRVTGLLSIALDVPPNQAVERLRQLDSGGKSLRMIGDDSGGGGEGIGTGEFILELLIWIIVMSLVVVGLLLGAVELIDWQQAAAEAAQAGEDPAVVDFYRDIDNINPMSIILAGFILGIAFIISNVFSAIVMWFVGTFLGGEGLLFTFIQYVLRAQMGILLLSIVGGFVGLVLVPANIAIAALAFGGTSVLGWGVMAWAVGKAHEFGMVMGCVNIILAQIVCGVMQCGLSFFGSAGV